MRKLLIIAVVFFTGSCLLSGQGDLNEQQRIFFRNEKSFAVQLNTEGFGLGYREGKRINYLNKKLLEFEFGILKHPKEVKLSNPYYQTPGTFIFGKLNSVIYLRGGFGHQREIFRKADLGGVAIRYFYTAGPDLAIYKPIYYKILIPKSSVDFDIKIEKLDINIHTPGDIYSKARFTKGLNETKFLPGAFAKGGFNFEYSKQDKIIHAIEIGAQINLFPKKIPIMATSTNKFAYFSLFVSYRIGIVIDPLDPESNKLSNILFRKRQ